MYKDKQGRHHAGCTCTLVCLRSFRRYYQREYKNWRPGGRQIAAKVHVEICRLARNHTSAGIPNRTACWPCRGTYSSNPSRYPDPARHSAVDGGRDLCSAVTDAARIRPRVGVPAGSRTTQTANSHSWPQNSTHAYGPSTSTGCTPCVRCACRPEAISTFICSAHDVCARFRTDLEVTSMRTLKVHACRRRAAATRAALTHPAYIHTHIYS